MLTSVFMKAVLRLKPRQAGTRVRHCWWSEGTPIRGSHRRISSVLGGQRGAFVLELLIGSIIVGIALVGLGLLFARGQATIVGEGSQRVEQHLAEQQLENYRSAGFPAATCVDPPGPCPGSKTENVTAGESGALTFTRTTCAYYVDNNTLLPAGGVAPPSPCLAGAVTRTLRVTVTVTPPSQQTDSVTLETILINPS